MKNFKLFLTTLLFSFAAWSGVGGTIGGSSSMTIEQLQADAKFILKSPQVKFAEGHSLIFMPVIETCLANEIDGLTLKSLKPQVYLKKTTSDKVRIEDEAILTKVVDEQSADLLKPVPVEVYRYMDQYLKNQKPLFIKEFNIPDCPK